MAPKKRSSSCWEAKRCSTKSAKSVQKHVPSALPKPRRLWKRPRLRRKRKAALPKLAKRQKKKKRSNVGQVPQSAEYVVNGLRGQEDFSAFLPFAIILRNLGSNY